MARKIVPLITGEKYHVFNRGVDKRTVFNDKFDYLRFYQSIQFFNILEPSINFRLAKFRHNLELEPLVKVYAYSLLPNHFHLILEQLQNDGVSSFMKRLSAGYTGYFNERNKRSGILFQGNYKRVHIETQEQFQYLLAYVNENEYVHSIKREREIFNTSSLHYQRNKFSKILPTSTLPYDSNESKLLAIDIYNKRSTFKDTLE